VATVSIDRVDFMRGIVQLDLVRLEGKLIQTGNSSMVVEVKGYRQNLNTRSFTLVCISYVTMVAISPTGVPRKGIPPISYRTEQENLLRVEAARRKELYNKWVELHQDVDNMTNLVASEIEDPLNIEGKTEFLTIPQTEVFVKRQFFPKHVNFNSTIFGGEVVLWMDKVATHTARHFTKNHYMLTVSMNRVTFKKPIFPTDVVEMRARVVYVRTHVIEVEIDVTVQRINGDRISSHSGYFMIINADETGSKVQLSTGLKLEDSDQESLKQYLKAKRRFAFGLSTDKRPTPSQFSQNFTLKPTNTLSKSTSTHSLQSANNKN
jgi:acyl-CoA thioesterase 11/acyl-coenzyme A thioesterase 9